MSVRASVIQAAPVAFDRERTLDRVARLTAQAAADGAQLVVFPEAFVSGYPKGAEFGARVGSRSAKGREWFRRYHESSVDVPGPAVERLGEICRANAVHLVIGVIAGFFSEPARDFARAVIRNSAYTILRIEGPDVDRLGRDEAELSKVLQREAKLAQAIRASVLDTVDHVDNQNIRPIS